MTFKKLKPFLLFFVIFFTSFLLGFFVSFYFIKNNIYGIYGNEEYKLGIIENKEQTLENNLKDSSGSILKKDNLLKSISKSFLKKDLDLDLFWQVYNLIFYNYYSFETIDKSKLENEVIKGLVNGLGDKFSEYLTKTEAKEFEDVLNGDFEGIGAVIEKHDLGVLVERILKGSPASKYGILKGDIIVEANGVELKDLNLLDAVKNIKGPAGTNVKLKIIRNGEKDFLIKDVVRDKIKIPSVDTMDLKDEEIGYISINTFGDNTRNEFKELLDSFNNEKIKGIIIDLRDNGGGYLQTAVEILSFLIEKNKLLVTVKYKDSIMNDNYFSENNGNIFDKKIVVLLNGNSRSASEIVAGALKDHNKAIIVGEKSYGKGSVQQPFHLNDGSMLKLTIAKWYTPNDYSIDGNGISPDIEVLFKKEDYENKYDRQLEEAKKVLKKFIKLDNKALVVNEFVKDTSNTGSLNE